MIPGQVTGSKCSWGKGSDKFGIGSRVEVVAGKTKMIREIDGGSSHLSQNSAIAHFGIGDAEIADSVVVKWTGGGKQIFTSVKANTMLTVIEEEKPAESATIPVVITILLVLGAGIFLFRMFSSRLHVTN
jgi:enediyne biosynthesis protein E4